MPTSSTRAGFQGSFEVDHRDGAGNLIARDFTINLPPLPDCLKFSCVVKFAWACLTVAFIQAYHAKRVTYAEKNRRKKILDRYRTGEPSPSNLWQAIHANIKLRCPICRKYNVDPLLFGGH
jgi:hypothetical protein